MITIFKEWKGQLGWTFTAEECREEWHAKRVAAKFMKKKYRQPKGGKWSSRRGETVIDTSIHANDTRRIVY